MISAKYFRLYTLLIFLSWLAIGCNDKCKKVDCNEPYGVCVDGTCDCSDGYEGSDCKIISRNKFLGSYIVHDTCNIGIATFPGKIINGSGTNGIIITLNSAQADSIHLNATISANNITVPSQYIYNSTFLTASGQYFSADSSIILDYTTIDTLFNSTDTCRSVWIRQ